jgi:D-alanyl-D-alanine carboxypeptidase
VRIAVLAAALAFSLGVVAGSEAGAPSDTVSQGPAAFRGDISPIRGDLAKWMTGVSWRPGCPVPLRDLRVLSLSYHRFDRKTRVGRLIVHADVAPEMIDVFRTLYRARFPIRRLVPVDAYGASDFRSIEADNTSAFNCRFVDGTTRWSEHAYGRAIDVNPIENPYVSGGRTSHPASVPYVDRSRRRPGMAYEGGVLVRAFDAIGWGWGGRWTSVKDYQHFSASGG